LKKFEDDYLEHIKWGCLVSESRVGPRYPSLKKIENFLENLDVNLHICGQLARSINDYTSLPLWFIEIINNHYNDMQLQINLSDYNFENLQKFQNLFALYPMILQWREESFCNSHPKFNWLFDRSGGKGIKSEIYPRFFYKVSNYNYNGFAGGINPNNVAEIVAKLEEKNPDTFFYLDIETGVRDENDQFSFKKCAQIMEIVYG
jgi:phosphoribosylanthranilate isomerase